VLLRITENLSVTPLGGFATAGPTTGWVDPSATRYTLTNIAGQGATVIDWTAHADQPWVRLSGAAAAGGSIADGETTHVIVQVLDELLQPIPAGETEAEALAVVTFEDRSNGEMTARTVWVRRTNPRFDLDLASVSDRARQPAGPAYPFQIGRFHVTNAAFVAFLNDARNHPGDERGAHMYFDTTTGDVYVNTSTTGESGEGAAGRATLMFAPGATDGIEFVDGAYRVAAAPNDMGSHPVTNVSWFGAVKHCNWLTLDQGMLPGDRCYVEAAAPDATGWRPASISATDWSTRDLNDAERRALVTDFRGFRLPMDDGYGNATPSADAADAYNEWYKAAAWNEALRRNTVYGVGRDPLADGDANFRCSGDPFEDVADCERGGSTPVGFYDGAAKTTPAGSLMTRATDNSFGLHDMTGNVHQWLQGRYAPPASFARRTLRGGSWNDAAASDALRAARRPLYAPPSTTSDQIGFRVVRSLGARSADADLDGDVDLVDLAAAAACLGGPSGGVRSGCSMFDLDADGDVDLLDIEAMSRSFTHTN
jgi:formylglycine-generating enzyme required for sulfatase activity